MRGERKGREATRRDIDAEFLGQLADQRRLRGLAAIDLAAGKLPETRHRLALRALRQQDAAVGVDQRHRRYQDDPVRRVSCDNCH